MVLIGICSTSGGFGKLLKEFRFDEGLAEAVVEAIKYTSNT